MIIESTCRNPKSFHVENGFLAFNGAELGRPKWRSDSNSSGVLKI